MSLDLDDVEEEEGGRAEEDGAEDDEPFVQHDRLIDPSAFAFDLCICCFRYYCRGLKIGPKSFLVLYWVLPYTLRQWFPNFSESWPVLQ